MNTEQAKAIFNNCIENETDSDRIAKVELLREYFCNESFKKYVQDTVANINGVK